MQIESNNQTGGDLIAFTFRATWRIALVMFVGLAFHFLSTY